MTKRLPWDPVRPNASHSVWKQLNKSFELDPVVLEQMFGISKTNITKKKPASSSNKSETMVAILDKTKAHHFGIQLRALSLIREEVSDALLAGDGLSDDILEALVKVKPTDDEKKKFQKFDEDPERLGTADRFIYSLLAVPNAWLRLEAMLFKARYKEELDSAWESIETLKMACTELKGSRTFRKLLEAVLKTGNRLNMGTYRGNAQAFKLDNLLKLADVKGVDNKTTLLHFVIQEIEKSESLRLARLAGKEVNNSPPVSPKTPNTPNTSDFSASLEAAMMAENAPNPQTGDEATKKMGIGSVMRLPLELSMASKAGGFDLNMLQESVRMLVKGLQGIKAQVQEGRYSIPESEPMLRARAIDLSQDIFQQTMENFIKNADANVTIVQEELDEVLEAVQLTNIYFYGSEAARSNFEPLKAFVVVRHFIVMLDKACKDITRYKAQAKTRG